MDKTINNSVSIILPCKNEAPAIGHCLKQIAAMAAKHALDIEVIVSDSSTDESADIAETFGVRVLRHQRDGYGNAYLAAIPLASHRFLFMADADGSYDFEEVPTFIRHLNDGFDFVVGDRFAGTIDAGAMPPLHRYLGNPLLSFLSRLLFRSPVRDVHCGMRAITKESFEKLALKTTGMEFATEMVIKAARLHLKTKQVPIRYHCRLGVSKLKTFADGWRHLRFMLLYKPLFLFFIPGALIAATGIVMMALLYGDLLTVFGLHFYHHPMFISCLLVVIGYQLMIFSLFAKTYAMVHLDDTSALITRLQKHVTIEKASLAGTLSVVGGIAIYAWILWQWLASGFGPLAEVKNSLVALLLITIGIQTIFSSFMLSILGIKEK